MAKRQTGGDNRERRALAKQARDEGKKASEVGASTSADKQRTRADADDNMTHQEKLDLKNEGKQHTHGAKSQTARPGSRDADSLDREHHPRM